MAYIVMSMRAKAEIRGSIHDFLETTLGPLVTEDAIRYAPMRSGALKGSIRYWVEAETLYVGAFVDYATYVELGHRVWHRFKRQLGPEVVAPEPYLRPALYKYRSPELPGGTPPLIPPGVQHPRRAFQFLSFTQWYKQKYGGTADPNARRPLQMDISGPFAIHYSAGKRR